MNSSKRDSFADLDRKKRKLSEHTVGMVLQPPHKPDSPIKKALKQSLKKIERDKQNIYLRNF